MSSIIAIGLLGKLFQILSLQRFHEIYYDDTSVWTEEKSYTFAVSKTVCIPSCGLLFSSVCAECAGPNIDILIFPLGLKTVFCSCQLVAFLLLSLVYIECARYLYTNCDVKWQTYMFTS